MSLGGPPGSSDTLAVVTPLDSSTKNEIIIAIGGFVFDLAARNNRMREWAADSKRPWMERQRSEQASKRVTRGARGRAKRSAESNKITFAGTFQIIDTAVELITTAPAGELKVPVALMVTALEGEGGGGQSRVCTDVISRLSAGDFANRDSKPPYLVVVRRKGGLGTVGHFTLYVYRFEADKVAVAVYDSFNHADADERLDEELAVALLRRYFGNEKGGGEVKIGEKRAFLNAVLGDYGGRIPLHSVSWSMMAGFRLIQSQRDGVTCGYQCLLSLLLLVVKWPASVSSAIQGKAFVTPTPLLLLAQSLVIEVAGRLTGTVLGKRLDEAVGYEGLTDTTTTTSTTTTTTTATGSDLVTID